jgi:site-specific recombinase XerD
MREVLKRYIAYLKAEHNASQYTIRNYRTDLVGTSKRGAGKGFFQFLLLNNISDLREVDKQTIRNYLTWLVNQNIEKSSLSRKLSVIRSFYRFLLREGIINESPIPINASGRKGERSSLSPKLDKRLPVFLTQTEVQELINTPDLKRSEGKRDRAIIELLYATGLRVSELTNLDVADINLDSHEIHTLGKGSKERIVLIGNPAAVAISDYLENARNKLLKGKNNTALFVSRFGSRLINRRIQKMIQRYSILCGLEKKVHPHVMRHTFATHMLDGGADLRVVQELLGHADLSSTQIYTHITKQQAKKVYLLAHPLAREKESSSGL